MTKKEGILYADGTFIHLNRWLLAIVIITRDFKRWWRDQTLKFDPTNQMIRLKLWIVCVVRLHIIPFYLSMVNKEPHRNSLFMVYFFHYSEEVIKCNSFGSNINVENLLAGIRNVRWAISNFFLAALYELMILLLDHRQLKRIKKKGKNVDNVSSLLLYPKTHC